MVRYGESQLLGPFGPLNPSVGGVRPLKKFTLPGGGAVYIVAAKVTGVTRAIPYQSHPNAHAIIKLA